MYIKGSVSKLSLPPGPGICFPDSAFGPGKWQPGGFIIAGHKTTMTWLEGGARTLEKRGNYYDNVNYTCTFRIDPTRRHGEEDAAEFHLEPPKAALTAAVVVVIVLDVAVAGNNCHATCGTPIQ